MRSLVRMQTTYPRRIRTALCVGLLLWARALVAADSATEDGWISLFNGRDLDGWTPKIAKHALGENFANTFRVEDGAIKVSYADYQTFDQQFGHLFSALPYSHYRLQLEYRFTGQPCAGAPKWAAFNSGIMLHAQAPVSMTRDQSFPVSIEAQFLAVGATAGKQTGNACTPGTDVDVRGVFTKEHTISATGSLSPLDEWVRFEAEVHGHERMIFRINGEEVLRIERPKLDPVDRDAQRLLALGADPKVAAGHLALQAEGHAVWFRNIRIKPLPHD